MSNNGRFEKGHTPWNAGTKGLVRAWNKGKHKPIIYFDKGTYIKVKLNGRYGKNKFALIDSEDLLLIKKCSWWAMRHRKTFYARGKVDGKSIQMHRLILKLTDPRQQTDHINFNGLDNRKSNLRVCNSIENARNHSKQKNNTSGYKGVVYYKSKPWQNRRRWLARISLNKRRICLGYFSTPIEAAIAYDKAARRFFGKFAKTNF